MKYEVIEAFSAMLEDGSMVDEVYIDRDACSEDNPDDVVVDGFTIVDEQNNVLKDESNSNYFFETKEEAIQEKETL